MRTSSANAAIAATASSLSVGVAAHELGGDPVLDARAGRGTPAPGRRSGAPAPMPMVGTSTASVTMAGDLVGHALEHDGEAAGVRRAPWRRRPARSAASALLALHLEAAHGVHRLRGEAEVAHHRDLGVDDGLDHRHALAAALELHAWAPARISVAALRTVSSTRHVVAHPRQVADDQAARAWPGPRPRCGGPCRRWSPAGCRRSRARPWPASRRPGSGRRRRRRRCGRPGAS